MDDIISAACDLSNRLFDGADKKLLDLIIDDSGKDVYLTVPDTIITLFERAFYVCEVFNFSRKQMDGLRWLNRVNIFPSVDWAITLYYKDYPLTKDNWMIRKISITSTFKIKDGNCSKEIIELNELITLSQERVQLN